MIEKQIEKNKMLTKKIALASCLIALGVVIAPFLWFPFLYTKCYPGQHLINVLAGILLGPHWAALIATIIGIIRISLHIGSIYAFPGGIPGGVVVGLFNILFKKLNIRNDISALTEPLGTVFIGGTLSVYIVAPLAGHITMIGALLPIWFAFGISSIIGSIMGFTVIKVLDRVGILSRITYK